MLLIDLDFLDVLHRARIEKLGMGLLPGFPRKFTKGDEIDCFHSGILRERIA